MKLIAGLGNPGNRYINTRHNAGFIVLDYLAESLNLSFKAGKGDYYFVEHSVGNKGFFLLKPTTYMNNSGLAVLDFVSRYGIQLRDILVVYDDFNLPLGTIRVRPKGSDGGHNGISSIIYHLETFEFGRMRIGIGIDKEIKNDDYVDFVLSEFTPDEQKLFSKMLPVYKDCILEFITSDIGAVMNKFNRNFLGEQNNQQENIKDS